MIDPRNSATFGGSGVPDVPAAPPGTHGEHLDDLTAMMLADGERLASPAAHAASCRVCAARIADFRAEAGALARAFALDVEEAALLAASRLPARLAAWNGAVSGRLALAQRWETPAVLIAAIAVAATGTLGWQLTSSLMATGLDTASRAGATAVLANALMGWLIAFAQFAWSAIDTVTQLPAIDSPALPLLAITAVLWALLVLIPRPAPAARTATA